MTEVAFAVGLALWALWFIAVMTRQSRVITAQQREIDQLAEVVRDQRQAIWLLELQVRRQLPPAPAADGVTCPPA